MNLIKLVFLSVLFTSAVSCYKYNDNEEDYTTACYEVKTIKTVADGSTTNVQTRCNVTAQQLRQEKDETERYEKDPFCIVRFLYKKL